ncbi:unnamed protein product [Gemmata massiliana]|uniref:Knr4/Smi1-like domain-containing protein n=1 Tax=Gemmata massiliana TaxID=1210884 RepID=A0A6P2CZJ5_9BACT|nr:SMI1/KNR4 family protein [Gemmata massiliana]VTR93786.1 unnamed protein product [Gemmata massiliana]
MTDFSRLTACPGVTPASGATASEFDTFGAQTGLTIPPQLRRLYEHCNGLVIDGQRGSLRILSLNEVADCVHNSQKLGTSGVWGYFPFTDLNDSNPHCVCCAGPVSGYIVRVNHDDIARIEYRSLGSFLDTICKVLEAPTAELDDGPSLWELPQELHLTTSDRTSDDVETAQRLLAFATTLEEGSTERADAERWAITLFSENEVSEVAQFLDNGDEYQRATALAKLSRITSPQAQSAIQQHRQEVRAFSRQVVDALKSAGLTVAEVHDDCPRLEPGTVWLNVPMFFTDRRSPTIMIDIVKRARELIALNTQGTA